MPSKYKPVPRISLSTTELLTAADAIVPVATGVLETLIKRCIELAQDDQIVAPRRRRGRGAQLQPSEQLLVMFWAQVVSNRASDIATALGMHTRTVARVLSSKKYQKVEQYISARAVERAIEGAYGRSGLASYRRFSRSQRRGKA